MEEMKMLNGKILSDEILQNISEEIEQKSEQCGRVPRLELILVGYDFGSIKYVQMKKKVADKIGMECNIRHLDTTATTQEVLDLINNLNQDPLVDGLMVQLPLPEHIDSNEILDSIAPNKDVDGLTATNLGGLFQKKPTAIAPATPLGIMELLKEYRIKIFGKKVVIVGASNIIGIPLSAMMLEKNATVVICNKHTVDLLEVTKTADILVSATGVPELIKKEYIKPGVVLIDVGSNKHPETGKLVGDVDFNSVEGIPSYITPVPGGVGPMTIASLMLNLMKIYNENTRPN
jgi:methylenetetrahydrofolate dehydrogenase (NADP+)/methenyltetrahydrofolate cyclohydrolase